MTEAKFLAANPSVPTQNEIWEPVVISGETIEREAERLLSLDVADPIERQVRIVHPMACARGQGLAPGIEVRLAALKPGERIVLVAVASSHRGAAFAACEFLMDYLKTRAPFWKREDRDGETHWVEARSSDDEAAQRWK